jgi:hypothetical protein
MIWIAVRRRNFGHALPTHRTDQKILNAVLKILPRYRWLFERHYMLRYLIGLSTPFNTLLG